MKRLIIFVITAAVSIGIMNACGPSEEEIQRREQARQDSLERVRQQRLQQQRQDSIARARQDSIEAARAEAERNRIEFDENGRFSVQVEAWRSRDKAQAQVGKWVDRGYENAYVVKHGDEDTGNIWFRVRLGRVATMDMAKKLAGKLMDNHNANSWIMTVQDETPAGDEESGE